MSQPPSVDPEQFVLPTRTVPASVVVASRILAAMALLLIADMVAYAYALVTLGSTARRVGPGVGATDAQINNLISDLSAGYPLQLGLLFFFVGFLTLAAVYSRLGRRSGQYIGIAMAVPLLSCLPMLFLAPGLSRLEQAVAEAGPGWANSLDLASCAVTPLALIVIVLLLTRSARAWFSSLPAAPTGYMWVPAQLAGSDWSKWPVTPSNRIGEPPAGR
jgi:hypothetical protein